MYYILQHNDKNVPVYQLTSPNPKGHARVPWINGKHLRRPPAASLEFELDPDSGVLMPDFFDVDMPLFSPRLYKAFERAGVINILSYPVVIKNPATGEAIEDYHAINVVGVVSVADNNEFEKGEENSSRFLREIGDLSFDPERGHGQLCFRLLENLPSIVVHEDVVSQLSLDECVALKFRKLEAVYA